MNRSKSLTSEKPTTHPPLHCCPIENCLTVGEIICSNSAKKRPRLNWAFKLIRRERFSPYRPNSFTAQGASSTFHRELFLSPQTHRSSYRFRKLRRRQGERLKVFSLFHNFHHVSFVPHPRATFSLFFMNNQGFRGCGRYLTFHHILACITTTTFFQSTLTKHKRFYLTRMDYGEHHSHHSTERNIGILK